jgi:methionyl-tRNA formyltransferase
MSSAQSTLPQQVSPSDFRFAFAGDREIAVRVLASLVDNGYMPAVIFIPSDASHADQLLQLAQLPHERILVGRSLTEPSILHGLRELHLDIGVSIHFRYRMPPQILELPRIGWVNLHPSYLPYNRGVHTPSWTILDGTRAGATLHFMDEQFDTGDIIEQREVPVLPSDTAHLLYARILEAEFQLFSDAWPNLTCGACSRKPQHPDEGTAHRSSDLASRDLQRIELDQATTPRALLTKLRGLTTNSINEAAYFEEDGKRYRVQIAIRED